MTDNRTEPRIILFAGIILTIALVFAARLGDLRVRPGVWIPLAVGMTLFAWLGSRIGGRRSLWIFAIVFRLAAAFGDPWFSDDLWRYWWDGKVQMEGVGAWQYAPQAEELIPLRDEHWQRINHPELTTIYPPGAQLVFVSVVAVGRHPWAFKGLAALADLALLAWLAARVRRKETPPWVLWAFAWCPWVIFETAGSGHLEPLGALFLALAATTVARRRSIAAWVMAVQIKVVPIVALPVLARRWGVKRTLAAVLIVAAGFIPLALSRSSADGDGWRAYATRWEHNASVYSMTETALEYVVPIASAKRAIARLQEKHPDHPKLYDTLYRLIWPREFARLLLGGIGLLGLLWWAFRGPIDPVAGIRDAVLWLLLLSPTVHPWYALWLLPLALARARPSVLIWCACLLGTYVFSAEVPIAYRVVEYGVFGVAWWFDVRRERLAASD